MNIMEKFKKHPKIYGKIKISCFPCLHIEWSIHTQFFIILIIFYKVLVNFKRQ